MFYRFHDYLICLNDISAVYKKDCWFGMAYTIKILLNNGNKITTRYKFCATRDACFSNIQAIIARLKSVSTDDI